MPSVFLDRGAPPGDAALSKALGPAKPQWDRAVALLDGVPGARAEWKFYGAKHGWQLKYAAKKRALAYLIPNDGAFTAASALRDEELAALRAARFAASLLAEIEAAKPGPEGRPARFAVTTAASLAPFERVLAIKLRPA